MLELAYLHQARLMDIFPKRVMLDINKYYYIMQNTIYRLDIEPNDMRIIQYVSVNKNRELLWYIAAYPNWQTHNIENLAIFSLSDNVSIEGAKDFLEFINMLFTKMRFNKIVFNVIRENPARKSYEAFIKRNNVGRVVGTLKNHRLLKDGKYHDEIIMELYRDSYLEKDYMKYSIPTDSTFVQKKRKMPKIPMSHIEENNTASKC